MTSADVVEPDVVEPDVVEPEVLEHGHVLDRAWQVHPRVAVRPEPFGALLYHFGTRRLSFLKNHTVVTIVSSLHAHPDARSACRAAGVAEGAMSAYAKALETLAGSDMIVVREVHP